MPSALIRFLIRSLPAGAFIFALSLLAGASPADARERPRGDWHRYCKDVDIRGDWLEADCRKHNGKWRKNTRINFDNCPGNEVTVRDGHLVCERRYANNWSHGHGGWDNDRWDNRPWGWDNGRHNGWDRHDWDRSRHGHDRDWDRRRDHDRKDWDRKDWNKKDWTKRDDKDRRDGNWHDRNDRDRKQVNRDKERREERRRDNDRDDWWKRGQG